VNEDEDEDEKDAKNVSHNELSSNHVTVDDNYSENENENEVDSDLIIYD
jgi:hypothetical protein